MMELLTDPEAWIALATLTALEIVLGIDNIIFITIKDVEVMIAAIVIAIGVMMVSAQAISSFVDTHPTLKMLALSFLILIGTALLGEALDLHIPKGYIYFAMAFSIVVEMLNLRLRLRLRRRRPVALHKPGPPV